MYQKLVCVLCLVAVTCFLSVECSVDECLKHPERAQCRDGGPGPVGVLTISPRRLNLAGGDVVTVMPSNKTSPSDAVQIVQNSTTVSLGNLGSGSLTVPGMLSTKGIQPGPASLLIGGNPAEPIRFYRPPSYGNPKAKVSSGNEIPLWVGIAGEQKLIFLSDAQQLMRQLSVHFQEYVLGYANPSPENAEYTSNAKAAMTGLKEYVGYTNPAASNTIAVRSCNAGSNCFGNVEAQTPSTAILDLAVDRNGTVLGAILDNSVYAYLNPDTSFSENNRVMAAGVANPTLLGSGDLDGDGPCDLVVWDGTARTLNVLRQTRSGTTTSFALHGQLSMELTAALSGDVPRALYVNDIDSDGLQDVLYLVAGRVVWMVNQGPAQDGSIHFKQAGTLTVTANSLDSLSVGDVDGDGKVDIAVASKSDQNFVVYLNQAQ